MQEETNTPNLTLQPFMDFNVAGVQFRPSEIIEPLQSQGEICRLEAEPDNKFDPFAIKVLCRFVEEQGNDDGSDKVTWEHIGYVPKKHTQPLHMLRKAGIKPLLTTFVNQSAPSHEMILISVFYYGNPEAAFIE